MKVTGGQKMREGRCGNKKAASNGAQPKLHTSLRTLKEKSKRTQEEEGEWILNYLGAWVVEILTISGRGQGNSENWGW